MGVTGHRYAIIPAAIGAFLVVALVLLADAKGIWPFSSDVVITVSPLPSMTATPRVSVAPTVEPTVGWQTYTSSLYGYRVRVPDSWTINATASDTYFYEAMGIEVHNVISVVPNAGNKTLSEIEQELRASPTVGEVRTDITVDGQPAIWWINTDGIPVPEVDVIYMGYIYKITGLLTNQDILTTFGFAP